MEAARLLGAGLRRRVFEVALPLARPALAAGVALALMETLADYGVGAYFGLTTFTTGIYKAWLVMNDRIAAAQLASSLLAVVALLLWLERRAQQPPALCRQPQRRGARRRSAACCSSAPRGSAALLALCALPIVLGFVLPCAVAGLAAVARRRSTAEFGLPLQRFALVGRAQLQRSAAAAALAAAAMALAFGARAARRARHGAVAVAAGGAHWCRWAMRCRVR